MGWFATAASFVYTGEQMTSVNPLPPNLSVISSTSKLSFPVCVLPARFNYGRALKICAQAAISSDRPGAYDPELREVLELATDSELYELETILFGPSYFSPLLKSIPSRTEFDRAMIGVDLEERDEYIDALESRFLFLAADARSTLRGWRPSYRNVLLEVRKRLNIPCSSKLSTEDLEVEIFLHLLQDNTSEKSETFVDLLDLGTASNVQGGQLSQWKAQVLAAVKVGAGEFQSMILKGGGIFTFTKIYQLLSRKLSGKVLLEAANYQIKKELMKKGGQLAVVNLESRAALLAAKQGFLGAASRYVGIRSMMTLLGPVWGILFEKGLLELVWEILPKITFTQVEIKLSHMLTSDSVKPRLWGTFLADLVIQMLGTDYARILRAIYALAQIRVTRTYKLPSDASEG